MKNLPFGLDQQSDGFPSVAADGRRQSARLSCAYEPESAHADPRKAERDSNGALADVLEKAAEPSAATALLYGSGAGKRRCPAAWPTRAL